MKMRIPDSLTGHVGMTEFKDGVSIHQVSVNEVNIMRAVWTGMEVLEDDGVTVDQVLNDLFPVMPLEFYESAGIESPSKFLPRSDGTYAEGVDQNVVEQPVSAVTGGTKVSMYKRESLEEVASTRGISGLREIAKKHDLKANSIAALLELLMTVEAEEQPETQVPAPEGAPVQSEDQTPVEKTEDEKSAEEPEQKNEEPAEKAEG